MAKTTIYYYTIPMDVESTRAAALVAGGEPWYASSTAPQYTRDKPAGGGAVDLTTVLLKADNLSGVASAATARTNLGLGTAAQSATGAFDAAGAATAAQAAAIVVSAQRASNLSDLASAASARTNLGLGTAAVAAATDDDTLLQGGHTTTLRAETYPRWAAAANNSITAGIFYVTFFTPSKDLAVSNLSFASGSTVSASLTLARMGLYSVAGNGDLTLLAGTTSDTTLGNTANTLYTKSITTQNLVKGTRYATGIIFTGTTMPNAKGSGIVSGMSALAPKLSCQQGSQTDLPASVVAGSQANSGTAIWFAGS